MNISKIETDDGYYTVKIQLEPCTTNGNVLMVTVAKLIVEQTMANERFLFEGGAERVRFETDGVNPVAVWYKQKETDLAILCKKARHLQKVLSFRMDMYRLFERFMAIHREVITGE